MQPSVQEATNEVQQEQKNEDADAKTRKEEMLKEVILGLLDERSRRCKEEGEKELLRVATHLIKSNGFKLHGKNCIKCYEAEHSEKKQPPTEQSCK